MSSYLILSAFSPFRVGKISQWCWQVRFGAAKNVNKVTDKMMQACGGSGYKTDLGNKVPLRHVLFVLLSHLLFFSIWCSKALNGC